MNCEKCEYYVYHTPTLSEPSYDEYCKVYGECICTCDRFKLSKWQKRKSILNRIKKLERILK